MESTPRHSGEHPGEDTSRQRSTAPSGDVLTEALERFDALDAAPSARALLAQILTATLAAFTRTRSVRDPLPDTAPGSAQEALAVLGAVDHLRSSLAAVDAFWQVAAEERIRRDDAEVGVAPAEQGRGAGQEIALARRISPVASSFSQAKARRLVQTMPAAMERLRSGAMTAQQASSLSGALDGASAETCRRIDDHLGEHPHFLEGKGHKRLQSDVRKLVQRLEPETSRERAERAARSRHVTMTPLADGMARVSGVLRGIDAVALMQSLRTRAESLRAAGAKTSLPALEADLLVGDVLRGGEEESTTPDHPRPRSRVRPGLDVGIVITDSALLGRDDDAETAELEGYGSLPAHIVKDTLLGHPPGHLSADEDEEEHSDEVVSAFYRRLYRSPRTNELTGMESKARAFPAGLARMIRWRDTTCRTPWCNAKIRHSDHVEPHNLGGATSYANGQGLCARCNLLKEHGLWILSPLAPAEASPGPAQPAPSAPPAAWLWESPHGAVGTSPTPPLIIPGPQRPPQERVPRDENRGTRDPDGPAPPRASPAA